MIQRPKIIVGDAKFEPGTSAQKSGGALPMSYYISRPNLGNGYVGHLYSLCHLYQLQILTIYYFPLVSKMFFIYKIFSIFSVNRHSLLSWY